MIRTAAVFAFALGCAQVAPALAAPVCPDLIKASLAPKSYHTELVRTANGRTTTSTIDLQRPDHVHTKLASGREMLIVGSRTWMRKSGGAWQLLPNLNFGSTLADIDPAKMISEMKGVTCTDAGMGTWHAQAAHLYKMDYKGGFEGEIHSTIYVLGDGFVHHIDSTSERGTTTMDYSRFNEVTVSPP